MERDQRNLIRAAGRAAGVPAERIAAGIATMEGRAPEPAKSDAVAVRQARVCELLDCSRFHVRKLEKLGLLKPCDVAGLKRYPIAQVLALVGGEVDRA